MSDSLKDIPRPELIANARQAVINSIGEPGRPTFYEWDADVRKVLGDRLDDDLLSMTSVGYSTFIGYLHTNPLAMSGDVTEINRLRDQIHRETKAYRADKSHFASAGQSTC